MYDVCIIGSGPSGISASIYAKRFNLNVVIFEKETPGGLISQTTNISNYPGFSSIDGADLAYKMYQQMLDLKVTFKLENIKEIIVNKDNTFKIIGKKEYFSKTVIIATGTTPKTLNIESEARFFHKGISWCSVCDGMLYKDKDACVIGGGNSALTEALYLSKICRKVYLIHRRDTFRAEAKLLDDVLKIPNIIILKNKNVIEFHGKDNLEQITILDNITNEKETIDVACCFESIGKIPNSALVNIAKDNEGFIITNDLMETSQKGMYAIGDVIKKRVRQIATATADGVIASYAINEYLR